MIAKYPITKRLKEFALSIRSVKLNYGIEKFSSIICNHVKSWGSNLFAEESRTKDIVFEDLWALFMVAYNCEKFSNKKEKMSELINDGIDRGVIKKGMTFEKMFPGEKPPMEIFTVKQCFVPKKCAAVENSELYKNLFAEDLFPEEDAYVSVFYSDINQLTNLQLANVEKFIIDYIEGQFEELSSSGLKNEYWLFAFYLMFKEVDANQLLWERLIKTCYDDEYAKGKSKDDFEWRVLYEKTLAENKTIRKPTYYTKPNVVYFDNQDAEISSTNLPIFNIRYDIEDMKNTLGEDNYEEKLEKCTKGKLKLADVFLMIYRGNYLDAKVKKNKDLIFMQTCRDLLEFRIKVPFYRFDFINEPDIPEDAFSLEAFDLTVIIRKWLKKNMLENENDRKLVEILRGNIMEGNLKFLDVVATDFKFIRKLPDSRVKILKGEIEELVSDFKKKNLR